MVSVEATHRTKQPKNKKITMAVRRGILQTHEKEGGY